MPTFRTNKPTAPPIPDGCHVAKVVKAEERTSENGNAMIVMKLQLSEGQTLPCCLTFVNKARAAINAFCNSAELLCPEGSDVEVNLTTADCLGRYLYVTIINEDDGQGGDPFPKIVRFLTREAALIKNPAIANVKLQPQQPRNLRPIP